MIDTSIIIEANIEDAPAINELSQALGYDSLPAGVLNDNLDNIPGSNLNKLWVFENENKILAWVHAFSAYRVGSLPSIEIGGMVVEPLSRRNGVGRRLVEQAKQWADEKNLVLRVRCNIKRC